jgi:hypothetical protein
MLNRSRKRRPADPNQLGASIVQEATRNEVKQDTARQKNRAAVALGRLGGKVGGKARAAVLSAKRRSEIASLAARIRWRKGKDHGTE